ncbi:hypothetical protein [Halorubrum saccharovorum]|uniref:hypothetical protein n=1 Tax=Halorubrum saccharovorum TaxID=2248 RepID=UPI002AA2AB8A|nr:hypothetical protein [Halorubrum saccharovorum]
MQVAVADAIDERGLPVEGFVLAGIPRESCALRSDRTVSEVLSALSVAKVGLEALDRLFVADPPLVPRGSVVLTGVDADLLDDELLEREVVMLSEGIRDPAVAVVCQPLVRGRSVAGLIPTRYISSAISVS